MISDTSPFARLVASLLNSKLPLAIIVIAILVGSFALTYTPREEEPQITVPMIDIIVESSGASAAETEKLVTTPLEKLLAQIKGVEHLYSTTQSNQAIVTLRFYVGENREQALLNTYNKLHANTDKIPKLVTNWRVSPVEVDDVPILMLALWSDNANSIDDYGLRRLAEELSTTLQTIPQTSVIKVVGGRSRAIQIKLKPEKMASKQIAINEVIQALQTANQLQSLGNMQLSQQSVIIESGDVHRDIEELQRTPVAVINGSAILLKEIAEISDGPIEPTSYHWLDFTQSHQHYQGNDHPFVTLSIAKQKGVNAVEVSQAVLSKVAQLQQDIFPQAVHLKVLRDYGATANEKVNNLTISLAFAILTVIIFIGIFLGWQSALVVGLAIPVCYGITLALDFAFGYSINRVTLFALILSLGLLVDDPITGVDNIKRYLGQRNANKTNQILSAINEISTPLIMSTLTIVLAFLPLAFITGMMGPYMAPMAFNVPISVITSTLVAFLVTPWLAAKLIKLPHPASTQQATQAENSLYRRLLSLLLNNKSLGKMVLLGVFILFIIAALLPALRLVPLKLLPFDNKNEVQIIIDMPENSTLEQTAAITKAVANTASKLPEITTLASYVGEPSPIDFNGMVRQYYLRQASFYADIRLLLVDKAKREHQSHAIVLRLRRLLADFNRDGIKVKVVEVPPGPPVISTLVAELYGDQYTTFKQLANAAQQVSHRLQQEPHVVEVDTSITNNQTKLRFIADKTKAALSGISTQQINQTLAVANSPQTVSFLHQENEATSLPITLSLPLSERSTINDLQRIMLKGQNNSIQNSSALGLEKAPTPLVAVGELGQFKQLTHDQIIHHKDLKPVVYVTADISGRTPAEVIADISADFNNPAPSQQNKNWQTRSFFNNGSGTTWQLPDNINLVWSGEGEWRITLRVFRDMGLAFLFALTAIYLVLRIQTRSATLSAIIMSAIPLTIIGIMPGFFLLNQIGERTIAGAPEPILFTATAMIGMITLAGIVVRNSLILIEFIDQARASGATIKEALLQAGTVRLRPILLTAGTTLLGNLVITLDPVFSGLALAIIFGLIASTIFTLLVVPIVYLLVFDQPQTTALPETVHD